jgi:hypothetical protein
MKKITFILIVLFATAINTNAQIPNPGFENWYTSSNGFDPVGWITSNASPFVSVEQATPAYLGSFAVKVKTWQAGIMIVGGACQSNGFSFSSRPTALTGYVKCTIMPGDTASIAVTATLGGVNGVGVGAARKFYTSSVSSFTAFNLPIDYVSGSATDTIYIDIIAGKANTPLLGTEIIVDELSLTPATGINTLSSENKIDFQFNNETNNLTIIGENLKMLEIFDLTGKCVFKSGLYSTIDKIEFNINMLTNGLYLVKISDTKDDVFSRKILKY